MAILPTRATGKRCHHSDCASVVEKRGHNFTLNADFDAVDPVRYDALAGTYFFSFFSGTVHR